MKNIHLQASRAVLVVVLVTVGGAFIWWARHRPSYLQYQASKELAMGNQAAVVADYKRQLAKGNLSREDELRLRKGLGSIYVRSFEDTNGMSMFFSDKNKPENPFIGLAKKEFDRVLVLEPNDSNAHYYLGRILWIRHLESYAMQELDLARKADPKDPYPLWFLAFTNLDRGKPSEAVELALQAIAVAPGLDEARLILVDAYVDLGDFANAEDQYALLSPAMKAEPATMARHARSLAFQNKWADAIREVEEAERKAPHNGWVQLTMGEIMLLAGRNEEASGCYAVAASLLPDSLWPRVYQTEAFYIRGNCAASEEASNLIVEAFPNWVWSYMMSAWRQLCAGNADRALVSLDGALAVAPDHFDAIRLKAQILTDQRRFTELGVLIRGLLDKKKNQSDAYALLSRSFLLQGKRDMAQEMAETAININRQNAYAFLWLALCRAPLKDTQGAKFAFDMARSLRPFDKTIEGFEAFSNNKETELRAALNSNQRNPYLWLLLGQMCGRNERWGEAASAYQTAITLRPYLLDAHVGLVESFWKTDQKKLADGALSGALSVNSKDSDVLKWRSKIRNSR